MHSALAFRKKTAVRVNWVWMIDHGVSIDSVLASLHLAAMHLVSCFDLGTFSSMVSSFW
jgi:hypothetical protein